MDKKSKEVIKEVIKDLLNLRWKQHMADTLIPVGITLDDFKNKQIHASLAGRTLNLDDWLATERDEEHRRMKVKSKQRKTTEEYDTVLVKLNHLLERQDQYQEVLDIEKEMAKMQSKKIITTAEYAEIYNVSVKNQANYRNRIKDPLPYIQLAEGGKVTYNVDEVDEWIARQNKKR